MTSIYTLVAGFLMGVSLTGLMFYAMFSEEFRDREKAPRMLFFTKDGERLAVNVNQLTEVRNLVEHGWTEER